MQLKASVKTQQYLIQFRNTIMERYGNNTHYILSRYNGYFKKHYY